MCRTRFVYQSSLDRTMVRALLFDIDGTLSDSDDEMVDSLMNRLGFLKPILKEKGLHQFSRWLVHTAESPANSLLAFADRIGVDHHLARFLDNRANKKVHLPEKYPVIAGVPDMLEALKDRYPFAVVSARNDVTVRKFLEINELEHYFPVVISSQSVSKTKPFADPLLHAAERLGVPIENCLMVGDTLTDVRAALAAGAQSLSVLCGFGTEKELQRGGTHHILETTGQLADYLTSETDF